MTVALPPSIQRQADAAAAIEAQLASEQAAAAAPLGTVVPSAANLETGTVVSATQGVVSTPTETPEPVAPEPAMAPEPAPPKEDFEQKWRTLQGTFRAQSTKLRALEDELAQMRHTLAVEKAARIAEQEPPAQRVDPKDVETYGADLVEMVGRVAESKFGAVAAQFQERLKAVEEKLEAAAQTASQSVERVFYADLTRLVPDWQTVNEDARWLAWLNETDPVYGARRQDALDNASRAMDAQRVAAVFNAWKAALPRAPAAAPRPSLESQVAPRAAAPAPIPTAQPGVEIITQREVQMFYQALSKGEFRGREQEAAAMEQRINRAAAEGRIR